MNCYRDAYHYCDINPLDTVIAYFIDFCVCPTIIVLYPASAS